MKDLTKIDKPFGLLKPKVQKALEAHGGPYEYFNGVRWKPRLIAQPLHPAMTYRAAPEPQLTPDIIDWSQLPVEFKRAARDKNGVAFAVIDGVSNLGLCCWSHSGVKQIIRIDNLSLYEAGTCDWKDSLQVRPE